MEDINDEVGRASKYIKHFKKLLKNKKRIKVVIYCRDSKSWQYKNGNLIDQEKYLRRRLKFYEQKYAVKIYISIVSSVK